jgi:hypothetical protein
MTDPNYDSAHEFMQSMTRAKAEKAEADAPPLTNFEQIVKWIPSLTDDERRRLREMLR